MRLGCAHGRREWLDEDERAAWLRLVAVVELLPGVLDTQLRRDAGLTHFEYFVLAMLSEAPERTLRMTSLAQRTNATLPRLSHVVRRLEDRGLVRAVPLPRGRARHQRPAHRPGWDAVVAAAPGHVANVRSPRHRRAEPRAGGPARRHPVEPARAARPGRAHERAVVRAAEDFTHRGRRPDYDVLIRSPARGEEGGANSSDA